MKAVCLLLTMACGLGFAQNANTPKETPKFYKLDFVVKDLESGKVITSRSYSVLASTRGKTEIRAGSKIRVGTDASYNIVEVGTNFDCTDLIELPDEIAFNLIVEVSSVLDDKEPRGVIRQNRWLSYVLVPLKKPTVVFSSDDNTTKHVLQLEVTATPRT